MLNDSDSAFTTSGSKLTRSACATSREHEPTRKLFHSTARHDYRWAVDLTKKHLPGSQHEERKLPAVLIELV